ncbi:MAG: hypothetical protein JJT78_06615 [Leptospira sp.]|nr:hypothetical protein [Leptospira sp.]
MKLLNLKIYISSIIYFLGIFLVLGIFYVLLSKSVKKPTYIEWTKSSYASGYQIQIKNQKGIRIVDKRLEENKYPITDLDAGNYQMRVAVLSPFSQPVVWSQWRSLTIKAKSKTEERIVEEKSETLVDSKNKDSDQQNATNNMQDPLKDIPESSPCLTTKIPKEVIKECKKDYIVLDLDSNEKRAIYNVYILGGTNRSARIQILRYYKNECKTANSTVITKLKSLLDSTDPRINKNEKEEIHNTLEILENCK